MTSSGVVLDASALLVLLAGEPGDEVVAGALPGALISAVSWAEVVGKLDERGMSEAQIRAALGGLGLRIVPFDEAAAWAVGLLRSPTRALGLSLGDRACLALGRQRQAVVLTADRDWSKLKLKGVRVRVVR